jgi:histidinol phosphatase-like enzyme
LSINCDCRKPAPGLVEQAFSLGNGLDRKRSYIVGDKDADVGLAKNAGIKGVLVRTGYGRETEANLEKLELFPDFIADDIQEAVDWIIKDLKL